MDRLKTESCAGSDVISHDCNVARTLIYIVILDHGSAMLYHWQKCDQRAAIFLPEEPVSAGNRFACASINFENASHSARLIDQTRCTAS